MLLERSKSTSVNKRRSPRLCFHKELFMKDLFCLQSNINLEFGKLTSDFQGNYYINDHLIKDGEQLYIVTDTNIESVVVSFCNFNIYALDNTELYIGKRLGFEKL